VNRLGVRPPFTRCATTETIDARRNALFFSDVDCLVVVRRRYDRDAHAATLPAALLAYPKAIAFANVRYALPWLSAWRGRTRARRPKPEFNFGSFRLETCRVYHSSWHVVPLPGTIAGLLSFNG